MKSITDFGPYTEALDLLHRMAEERNKLREEQLEIMGRLKYDAVQTPQGASALERAKAILAEGELPPTTGETIDALRTREAEIRARLEVLDAALRMQPEAVERQRQLARAEALRARRRELDELRRKWVAAVHALHDAITAEDELLDELAAAGFGRQDPDVTAPVWLSRDLLKLAVREGI